MKELHPLVASVELSPTPILVHPSPMDHPVKQLTPNTSFNSTTAHIVQLQDPSVLDSHKLSGRVLVFQASWLEKHPWLHTCPVKNAAFCHTCVTASHMGLKNLSGNCDEAFVQKGFCNWKKALERFKSHEAIQSHSRARMILLQ